MTISEFAKSRNVEPQAVSRYLIRHEKEFEGLIESVGKERVLSEEAIKKLDKKYPLPKPVQVIEGVPQEQYDEAIETINRLTLMLERADSRSEKIQEKLEELTKKEAQLMAQTMMLEDREKREKERAAELEREVESYKKTIFGLYIKEKER